MPQISEKLTRYFYLKSLACEYFLSIKESSKVWNAIEEADALIDYLDVFRELSRYCQNSQETMCWIDDNRNKTYSQFKKAVEEIVLFFNEPHKLDPVINKYISQVREYVKFKSDMNDILPSERQNYLAEMVPRFKKNYFALEKSPLDGLLKEAENEMKSKFSIPSKQLNQWLPVLSFCNRTVLQTHSIFRIGQRYRHLVFFGQDAASHSTFNNIYQTEKLDNYLFLRDLRLGLLRKWGRFIPLEHNHLLVKFYNEPRYWDSVHMFRADMDHLRLGFAYFQYAMELGEDSEFTRMNYRKALHCFRKSKLSVPEALRERLWGI